jgi:3-deoxy-D-manno-octulosonate 8-phosphate phosphatase (KDO 8-P phosphatase)
VVDIKTVFSQMGGFLNDSPSELSKKIFDVKGFLFDWDGVFNDGRKSDSSSSGFSEGISMGINMLRFSFFLKQGYNPKIIIVTGEENPSAIKLAHREFFNGVFFKIKHKTDILPTLNAEFDCVPDQCAFFYDDILDLSLAKEVGFRTMIRNEAAPLLLDHVKKHKLAEYITAFDGGHNGLREACEFIIGVNDNYEETIQNRIEFSPEYRSYLKNRSSITPSFYTHDGKGISAVTNLK